MVGLSRDRRVAARSSAVPGLEEEGNGMIQISVVDEGLGGVEGERRPVKGGRVGCAELRLAHANDVIRIDQVRIDRLEAEPAAESVERIALIEVGRQSPLPKLLTEPHDGGKLGADDRVASRRNS